MGLYNWLFGWSPRREARLQARGRKLVEEVGARWAAEGYQPPSAAPWPLPNPVEVRQTDKGLEMTHHLPVGSSAERLLRDMASGELPHLSLGVPNKKPEQSVLSVSILQIKVELITMTLKLLLQEVASERKFVATIDLLQWREGARYFYEAPTPLGKDGPLNEDNY